MKQKINLRLTLIAILAITATALGLLVVYYNLFQTRVKSDLLVDARLLSETGLFQSLNEQAGGDPEKLDREALVRLESENLRITWISADGIVLYDNDQELGTLPNHLDRPEIQEALQSGVGSIVRKSDTKNMNIFYCALLLDDGTILRVSTQAKSITSVFLASVPVVLVIVIAIWCICILLGHFLIAQLIKPINQMAEHLDDSTNWVVYKELEPFSNKIRAQHENILAAAKSRQDFTANVSHELKTPLTAISGYAELMENGIATQEQVVHFSRQIRKNADRLLALINDIIRLSELDHLEIPRRFAQTDLLILAEECCRSLQINAENKKVTLTCEGESVMLSADTDLLKELTINLIQNAIQYNRENGSVTVTVTEEENRPVLRVRDTGIGIPEDQIERIFERFYRVDKSRSRETGGTGLGLAIVKHIAEIHSAQIQVKSRVGEGTEIIVTF